MIIPANPSRSNVSPGTKKSQLGEYRSMKRT
jgi:hypothetical protein